MLKLIQLRFNTSTVLTESMVKASTQDTNPHQTKRSHKIYLIAMQPPTINANGWVAIIRIQKLGELPTPNFSLLQSKSLTFINPYRLTELKDM